VLIARYHRPIYSRCRARCMTRRRGRLTRKSSSRFSGVGNFHGESFLRTWIYRIALHEAQTSGVGGCGTGSRRSRSSKE